MRIHKSILIALIIVVCSAAYFNTLFFNFVCDDNSLIVDNPYIRAFKFLPLFFTHDIWNISLEAISSGYYRPLLGASFMLDYALWQTNPFGYHLTNLIFHILVTILVFLLVEMLFKNRVIALSSALLFSVHPIHTEAVSFISGRVDVLCLFFFLLSLLLFLKYYSNKKFILYLLSLFCFFVALLVKEMALTLPLILLCIDYFFLSEKNFKGVVKNFLRLYLGFFIILAIYFLMRSFFVAWEFIKTPLPIPANPSHYWRIFMAIRSLINYIRLSVFPYGLKFLYESKTANFLFAPDIILGIIVISGLMFLAINNLKKSAIVTFSIFWFFITVLPVSNIVNPGCLLFSERFLYMPSVGFCIAMSFLFYGLTKYKPKTSFLNWRKSIVFIFILLIIALARVTFERNKVWENNFTLWYETANAQPENPTAHFLLGNVYAKANIFDKAIEEYNIVLKLNPMLFYDVFNSLGYIYNKKGLTDEAIKAYKISVSVPGRYRALVYNNLAGIYNRTGRYKEAIEAGISALKDNPYLNAAHYNLALSYTASGLIDKAIEEYEVYLKVNPEYYGAHVDLGHLYYKKGDFQKAKLHWQAALKIAKDYQPAKDALKLLGN